MIKVSELKAPYSLGVDITNECNYRCLHCYNCSGENNIVESELSDTEFINFFRDLGDIMIHSICFCGGEPLLKKDLIVKCCKEIKKKNPTVNLSMVSNGYYLTEDILNELIEGGIKHIQISLDGADENACFELRRNKLAFNKAVQALRILSQSSISYNIAFCPTKFNINQIDDIYKICQELNINEIRIQPLMMIGRANDNLVKILPNNIQYRSLLSRINKLNRLASAEIKIDWGDPIAHLYDQRENKDKVATYFSIKANGEISPSPYLPITVGSVKKYKFSEYCNRGLLGVWRLDIMQELAENIYSISDMSYSSENVPLAWKDEDLKIDIIEELDYRVV